MKNFAQFFVKRWYALSEVAFAIVFCLVMLPFLLVIALIDPDFVNDNAITDVFKKND